MARRTTPSFSSLYPASERSSKAARGASRKEGTKCELRLRRALWAMGYRYFLKIGRGLPGRPDIVFRGPRVVVFCDGDFWHGRDWPTRRRKLNAGHNPQYWVQKIERNIERDQRQTKALEDEGWVVLRYWEGDIHADVGAIARRIADVVDARRSCRRSATATTYLGEDDSHG